MVPFLNQELQLTLKAFVHIMGFKKSVMRIDIKIYSYFLFEGCFKFPLQAFNKFSYPAIVFIIFLPVADKDLPAGRQVSYSYPGMMLAIGGSYF
jgi:hypothetical protein